MKHKVRVKRKYQKQKKITTRRGLYFCLILLAALWLIYDMARLKVAKEWVDISGSVTPKINLPKDDGYHSNRMEWWYYNGHLVAESGREYSFHFTTFLVNDLMTHTVIHTSLGDHSQNKHYTSQSRIGGNPTVGVNDGFDFKYRNWVMRGGDGQDRIIVKNDEFAFDLKLESTQPVVNHGEGGIISLGSIGASYYYSRTRMNITGILNIGGKEEVVKGTSWFDHQWGDFSSVKLSWDWFSLQFNNGIDLMIYRLRNNEGVPVLYTASILENGKTEILDKGEFELVPGQQWVSDKTGNSYPVYWNIKIPRKKIDIQVESIIKNSEFDATLTTFMTYWEGAVKVEGSHTGQGFMELNGYGAKKK